MRKMKQMFNLVLISCMIINPKYTDASKLSIYLRKYLILDIQSLLHSLSFSDGFLRLRHTVYLKKGVNALFENSRNGNM